MNYWLHQTLQHFLATSSFDKNKDERTSNPLI